MRHVQTRETEVNNPSGPPVGAKGFLPAAPDFVQSLKMMGPGLGYWLRMYAADTMVYPTET